MLNAKVEDNKSARGKKMIFFLNLSDFQFNEMELSESSRRCGRLYMPRTLCRYNQIQIAPVYFDMFILVICISDIMFSTLHSMAELRIKQ